MKIALGLEYPLTLRGGVSVLVEKLIEGISLVHAVVLVSPDPAGFTHPGVCAHIHWEPAAVSRQTSARLADRLAALGVSLTHLHMGGNYGWGSRLPGHSPFPFLSRKGIVSVSTIHNAFSFLGSYCAGYRPIWFKLALLPAAWLGKIDVLRNVATEIVVSAGATRRVRRWYWPMRSRFRCLYHSRLAGNEPSPPIATREKIVLAVGSIAFHKGQHTLTEAFARIATDYPEWNLVLIGEGGLDSCLEKVNELIAVHKLQRRVLLLGNREDALEHMRRSAIFVQPSLIEGLPLALQEAMFSGCACIATRITGNEELITNERTGLLAPPLQVSRLADVLKRCIRDVALRQNFGRAGRDSILERGMTAPKMIEQHLLLYQAISNPQRDQSPVRVQAPTACPR